jgi:hypothetical protein
MQNLLLLETLVASERLATEYVRGPKKAATTAIEHLEALTASGRAKRERLNLLSLIAYRALSLRFSGKA